MQELVCSVFCLFLRECFCLFAFIFSENTAEAKYHKDQQRKMTGMYDTKEWNCLYT